MEDKSKQLWLSRIEGITLFIILPLLVYWDLIPLPKIVILLLVATYCGYQLWQDPNFGRGILRRETPNDVTKHILVRTIVVTIAVLGIIWLVQPNQFFSFPQERPFLWIAVMVLYPVLSALPQEFIYRTYFFHRYEGILPFKNADIILSALAFSFLHIIYDNWWALGLSFLAGLLFGITYARTKSLFWVSVEHAIYGCIVFTVGLGNHFYEPF